MDGIRSKLAQSFVVHASAFSCPLVQNDVCDVRPVLLTRQQQQQQRMIQTTAAVFLFFHACALLSVVYVRSLRVAVLHAKTNV